MGTKAVGLGSLGGLIAPFLYWFQSTGHTQWDALNGLGEGAAWGTAFLVVAMIATVITFLSTVANNDPARRAYWLGAPAGSTFVILGFVMAMCIVVVTYQMHTEYSGDLAFGPGWWLAAASSALVLLGGMGTKVEPARKLNP